MASDSSSLSEFQALLDHSMFNLASEAKSAILNFYKAKSASGIIIPPTFKGLRNSILAMLSAIAVDHSKFLLLIQKNLKLSESLDLFSLSGHLVPLISDSAIKDSWLEFLALRNSNPKENWFSIDIQQSYLLLFSLLSLFKVDHSFSFTLSDLMIEGLNSNEDSKDVLSNLNPFLSISDGNQILSFKSSDFSKVSNDLLEIFKIVLDFNPSDILFPFPSDVEITTSIQVASSESKVGKSTKSKVKSSVPCSAVAKSTGNPCSRTGVVEHSGAFYCKQHHKALN